MAYTSLRTIKDQGNYEAQIRLTYASISYQGILHITKDTALKLNVTSPLSQYRSHFKNECNIIVFTEEEARKYQFKPKLLSQLIYGNTDFYTLILRSNQMKSVSDFTMERLIEGIYIPRKGISDFLDEMLIKEKLPINRNREKVENDIRSLD